MENQRTEPEVVLIRHAQSQWDLENRFTGWADPALSEAGVVEAYQAGQLLREAGFRFDHSYSSRLQRTEHTLEILRSALGQAELTVGSDWRLNARHYGALQGVNKAEISARIGTEQINRLHRGFLELPPPQPLTDPRHPHNDARYADVPAHALPSMENLDMTRQRVMQFWQEQVVPLLRQGQRLLISTHGDTLRALIMSLNNLSVAEVEALEIPSAAPIVYRFDKQGSPLEWHYLDSKHCYHCAA